MRSREEMDDLKQGLVGTWKVDGDTYVVSAPDAGGLVARPSDDPSADDVGAAWVLSRGRKLAEDATATESRASELPPGTPFVYEGDIWREGVDEGVAFSEIWRDGAWRRTRNLLPGTFGRPASALELERAGVPLDDRSGLEVHGPSA